MSEKLTKRDSVNLHSVPSDCWSVISSFFRSSKDAFNILLFSKQIYDIFQSRNLRFFENVHFKFRSIVSKSEMKEEMKKGNEKSRESELILKEFSLFGRFQKIENPILFVNSLSIEVSDDRYGYSTSYKSVFSRKFSSDGNDERLIKIVDSFPSLRNLCMKAKFERKGSRPSYYNSEKNTEQNINYPVFNSSVLGNNSFHNIQSLHFRFPDCFKPCISLLCHLKNYRNLKKLTIEEFVEIESMNKYPFKTKLEELKNLKHLTLRRVVGLHCFLDYHEHLEYLELVEYTQTLKRSPHELSNKNKPRFSFPSLKVFIYNVDAPKKKDGYRGKLTNGAVTTKEFDFHDILNKNHKSLEKIHLIFSDSSRYGNRDSSGLSKCDNLRELKIFGNPPFDGKFLSQCKKLRKLDLSVDRKNSIDKETLLDGEIPNILHLNISRKSRYHDYDSSYDGSFLSKFPNLETLKMDKCCMDSCLRSCKMKPSDITDKFRKLRYLSITGCNHKEFTQDKIREIFRLNPNLEKIRIYKQYCIERAFALSSSFDVELVKVYEPDLNCLGIGFDEMKWFVPSHKDKNFIKKEMMRCKDGCTPFIRPFKCDKCKKLKCTCKGSWCDCGRSTGYKCNYCEMCVKKLGGGCASCGDEKCHKCNEVCGCDKVFCERCFPEHRRYCNEPTLDELYPEFAHLNHLDSD